jgi:hypothetical protein
MREISNCRITLKLLILMRVLRLDAFKRKCSTENLAFN